MPHQDPQYSAATHETAIAPFKAFIDAAPDGVAVVEATGRIIAVNPRLCGLFRYEPDELLGRRVEVLVPDRLGATHERHRRNFKSEPKICEMGSGLDLFGRRRDGSEFPIEITLSPVMADTRLLVVAIVRDVTARKAVTDDLVAALRAKDNLLKEVHHRTRNDMQTIASLLNLPKSAPAGRAAAEVLADCSHRVRAMAVIHHLLSRSEPDSPVDLAVYLGTLLEQIREAYCVDRPGIRLHAAIDAVPVPFQVASSIGLILHELVSNALKHAFPSGAGEIHVQLARSKTGITLRVADDGIGLSREPGSRQGDGIGLHLVESFTAQLGGSSQVSNGAGTVVTVSVPTA